MFLSKDWYDFAKVSWISGWRANAIFHVLEELFMERGAKDLFNAERSWSLQGELDVLEGRV